MRALILIAGAALALSACDNTPDNVQLNGIDNTSAENVQVQEDENGNVIVQDGTTVQDRDGNVKTAPALDPQT